MTTLNTTQTAKHTFQPIRVDLLDRLLDEADKIKATDKKPGFFGWKRK